MGFRSVLCENRFAIASLFVAFAVLNPGRQTHKADAAIFELANGGRIFGELVNAERTDQETFVIRPYRGGQITLAASNVLQVVPQKPLGIAYTKKRVAARAGPTHDAAPVAGRVGAGSDCAIGAHCCRGRRRLSAGLGCLLGRGRPRSSQVP